VSWYEQYKVDDLPENTVGPWTVTKENITASDTLMDTIQGRGTNPGTYTMLRKNGRIWMSDTRAEISDHMEAIIHIRRAEKVLIHGLGLGMVLNAALNQESVREVTVVELEPEVIELVGEHYMKKAADAGKQLTLLCDDAYTWTPSPNTKWDVVWHDIWPDMCPDYLKDMTKLHRRFGRRTNWQGSWGRTEMQRIARQEKKNPWW
jgi:spermidine synthase